MFNVDGYNGPKVLFYAIWHDFYLQNSTFWLSPGPNHPFVKSSKSHDVRALNTI